MNHGFAIMDQCRSAVLAADFGPVLAMLLATGPASAQPTFPATFGVWASGIKLSLPRGPQRSTPFDNSALRYLNDVVLTWKATPRLTFITEGNYIREDGFGAEGWGVAQYVSYALSDSVMLNGRTEIWSGNNFFVFVPVSNLDFTRTERGLSANPHTAPNPYGDDRDNGQFTLAADVILGF